MTLLKCFLSMYFLLHFGSGEVCFAPIDLAIVLDMSGSISEPNWLLMKEFTENIISDVTIGPNNTQIAIMTFATIVKHISHLDSTHDKQALLTTFKAYSRTPGWTFTHSALEQLRVTTYTTNNGDRPNAKDIVIFLTDGQSSFRSDTLTQANNLRVAIPSIHVFSIGIANYAESEVKAIASDPDSYYVSTIDTFTFLDAIKTILGPRFCQIGLDVIIGGTCTASSDCTAENSACNSGICSCAAQNFIYNSNTGKCEPRKSTDGNPVYCNTDMDCSFLYRAVCPSGHCECSSGTVCPPCQIDESCYDTMDCTNAITGWMCDSNQVQACNVSRRVKSPYICEMIKIGEACTTDENCTEVLNAACKNGQCQCEADGLSLTDDGLQCLPGAINSGCNSNTQCSLVSGAVCLSGSCECPAGTVCQKCELEEPCHSSMDCTNAIDGWICKANGDQGCKLSRRIKSPYVCEVIKGGEDCLLEESCAEILNAACKDGVCQCRDDRAMVLSEDRLRCDPRKIGDSCSFDRDCSLFYGAVCRSGKCECPSGTICPACKLRHSCDSSMDCSIPGWICISGVQDCKPSRKINSDYFCEINKFGDACTKDENCAEVADATCQNGVCRCKENALTPSNDRLKCLPRGLHDRCFDDDYCKYVKDAKCRSDVCHCVEGYVEVKDQNVCQKCSLGLACSTLADCNSVIRHTDCFTYLVCQSTYIEQNGSCRRIEFLDQCRPGAQYADCSHLSNGDCYQGKCQCKPGYIMSSLDPFECTKASLGSPCLLGDRDCESINKGTCGESGKCECRVGYKEESSTCRALIMGETCEGNSQEVCPYKGGRCLRGKCNCDTNYVNVGYCREKKRGDSCSSNSDCSFLDGGGFCNENKVCECSVGAYPAPSSSGCRIRKIGEQCSSHADCGYDGGACIPKVPDQGFVCGCSDAYLTTASGCNIRHYGDACTTSEKCPSSKGLECQAGFCNCSTGFILEEGGLFCEAILNSSCIRDEDCLEMVENSVCANTSNSSICICAEGFVINNKTLCAAIRLSGPCPTLGNDTCQKYIENGICKGDLCECEDGFAEEHETKCSQNSIQSAAAALSAGEIAGATFGSIALGGLLSTGVIAGVVIATKLGSAAAAGAAAAGAGVAAAQANTAALTSNVCAQFGAGACPAPGTECISYAPLHTFL